MNAKSTKELGSPEYWNNRYGEGAQSDQATHEWFRTFEKLRPFLEKELPDFKSDPRILHLGCGDSNLPAELYRLGYKNQISVDFSEVVIQQMQSRYPDLEWRVEDVKKLNLENSSIDIAIDKACFPRHLEVEKPLAELFQGTLDAMLYGSQWDPPDEVRANVAKYVDEVTRILRPTGRWLYVTWRQPHFVKPQLLREGIWDLVVERLEDSPGTFEYFAYVMTKIYKGDK